MGIVESVLDAYRFKDTIIYKESSDLQAKYDALKKLLQEYGDNDELLSELYTVKKGLAGENEISYQLKKSNIGMYVLRDIKVEYDDMTAQIDYVVITPVFTYYIECKNLVGNITVTEKGDFIREFVINGKKIKKGMYSPLRQVEAQREVMRKIWESKTSKIKKMFASKYFDYYQKTLVVAANQDTILDTSKAPKDIKYKVLRADALLRQIQYDLDHRSESDLYSSKKNMCLTAQYYLSLNVKDSINYYDYYKNKYLKNQDIIKNDDMKEKLINFRKSRAVELKIPAYYVFTNDELELLIKYRPKSLDELYNLKILSPVKIKTHGKNIIEEINNINKD